MMDRRWFLDAISPFIWGAGVWIILKNVPIPDNLFWAMMWTGPTMVLWVLASPCRGQRHPHTVKFMILMSWLGMLVSSWLIMTRLG